MCSIAAPGNVFWLHAGLNGHPCNSEPLEAPNRPAVGIGDGHLQGTRESYAYPLSMYHVVGWVGIDSRVCLLVFGLLPMCPICPPMVSNDRLTLLARLPPCGVKRLSCSSCAVAPCGFKRFLSIFFLPCFPQCVVG